MKKILAVLLAMCLVFACGACGENTTFTSEGDWEVPQILPPEPEKPDMSNVDMEKLNVIIETECGDIHVQLKPEVAPITVANFQKLVGEGFYDGLTFHRVIEGFMIQGGDPKGDGTGGTDEKIKGEFSANGVNNTLKHTRGVISMARSSDMDSASCQFFIMHADAAHLDGQYAAFGEVTEGIEVVDEIVANSVTEDANGTVAKENQLKINRIYFK